MLWGRVSGAVFCGQPESEPARCPEALTPRGGSVWGCHPGSVSHTQALAGGAVGGWPPLSEIQNHGSQGCFRLGVTEPPGSAPGDEVHRGQSELATEAEGLSAESVDTRDSRARDTGQLAPLPLIRQPSLLHTSMFKEEISPSAGVGLGHVSRACPG